MLEAVLKPVKKLIILAFCLLALPPVRAQLPPVADYPSDVRLPGPGSNRMHWTSTGAATWSLELSTNLVNWAAYTNLESSLPPGETEDLQVGLPAPTSQPQFARLTHRHAPPTIVTQPFNLGKVGTSYPLLARVDGDFPLLITWYQDGQPIFTETNTHDCGLSLLYLGPDTLGQLQGPYFATVANPWGSVTSQVTQLSFGPWPDFAPTTITNRILELNVQFQSLEYGVIQIGPAPLEAERFVVPARYRLKTASQGNACEIEGLSGIRGGPGTYEYGVGSEILGPGGIIIIPPFNDRHIAHLIFQTTRPDGGLFETHGLLTFRSATNGTFWLQNAGRTVGASGEFGFVQ